MDFAPGKEGRVPRMSLGGLVVVGNVFGLRMVRRSVVGILNLLKTNRASLS